MDSKIEETKVFGLETKQNEIEVKGLGINKSHGSSLCLVGENGEPIFCASEERFTRKKLQRGMPHLAFDFASRIYNLDKSEMSLGRLETAKRIEREKDYYSFGNKNNLFTIPVTARVAEVGRMWYKKKVQKDRNFHRLTMDTKYFIGKNLDNGFEHHLCHGASAYYCSGFDDAIVITYDGVGDLLGATVGYGKGEDYQIEKKFFFNECIAGQAYEVITGMLGFNPDRHPGKVTGLAAYAKPEPELIKELDDWFKAQYEKGAKDNWFYLIHRLEKEDESLEELRKLRESKFGKWSREQISSAIQFILERDATNFIKKHVPNPEGKNIALAGGIFANVKLNQRIKALGFKNIFIQPAMGDDGTGFGAALLGAHKNKPFKPYKLKDAYLGPGFSREEIKAALDEANLQYQELVGDDRPMERKLGKLLYKGYIIARYQGRMEFGPRALGNRSILYHAKDPSANDWLNEQLNRSEFMPFAPVTLAEYAKDCYKNVEGAEYAAKFMTITFDVTEEMQNASPACVHVDGTARPQLIDEETNPSYYWTLKYYHELSGIPSIINTSFNMHEEPIICTPQEAVKAYLQANLHALAIGDFLVINKDRPIENENK